MFELGENEKELHRETGAYAAAAGIDVLVCIGALATFMAEGAKEIPDRDIVVYHFDSKKEFFTKMDSILKARDTILVKASHGMEFAEIVNVLKNK